jgi:hypothetical protein
LSKLCEWYIPGTKYECDSKVKPGYAYCPKHLKEWHERKNKDITLEQKKQVFDLIVKYAPGGFDTTEYDYWKGVEGLELIPHKQYKKIWFLRERKIQGTMVDRIFLGF